MTFKQRTELAANAIAQAEYVLIGGGAGLSDAAGLTYSGLRFADSFADFINRYGLTDMYSSAFYPFETQEEFWAYWARHIYVNRFEPSATELYITLLRLVHAKPHFVLTTNVDGQFAKAGFAPEKIFAIQGDYGFLQCAMGCHDTRYGNEELVKRMLAETSDCRLPAQIVPTCPVCSGKMDINIRHSEHFVEDAAWREANARYELFLQEMRGKRVVLLELGVGFNTPGIIRFPFERMTYRNKDTTLIRLNRDESQGFAETEDRTIAFAEKMSTTIETLSIQGGIQNESVD